MNVVIIDYGLGNIRSVAGAVRRLGYEPIVSNSAEDLHAADKLILPGVGAFGDGMKNLRNLSLIDSLNHAVLIRNKPILGICLGLQLMAKESYEFGHHEGLGWLDASVVRIETNDENLRIPHVGWNNLIRVKDNILFDGIPDDALFYYTHSFHIQLKDYNIAIGECDYGMRFVSVINQNNIYGTQFHPEKSQFYGLALLKNFLNKI